MSYTCAWCGKPVPEETDAATTDTCEECEDFFEEHTDDITDTLNKLLDDNEAASPKSPAERKKSAWVSYSLISAVHMFAGEPTKEFKDSKFVKDL
ncbi:MAG: hypothetical protein AABZ39_15155 [Spirochaetota bacterium]